MLNRLKCPSSLWFLAAFAVLATGCITIEEHYTFKKNGSGTMEYVVDMSAMGEAMSNWKSVKSDDKSEEDGMGMEAKAEQLKGLEGIKRVKVKEEDDGYIQRVKFSFEDLDALNKALNILMPDSTGVQQTFFRWEGNTLVRTSNQNATELGENMAGEDSTANDYGEILKSMLYKFSFKFAKPVKEVKLAEGVMQESPSAKRLELATDWSVIMKDPKALDLRITVDK